jgi:hypothetical protein
MVKLERHLDAKQILADLDAREKSRRHTTEPKVKRGTDDLLYYEAEIVE